MTMARRLRILHISDLHERAPFPGVPEKRSRQLGIDVRQRGYVLGPQFLLALQSLASSPIDMVCFTGDLADWGIREEYQQAGARLDRILNEVGVPRSRFFAVPGNHDVHRPTNERAWKAARIWLERTEEKERIGRWIHGVGESPPGLERVSPARILERTRAFWTWYGEYTGTSRVPRSDCPLGYRVTLEPGQIDGVNVPVHIVGLDSAWLCGEAKMTTATVLKDQGSIRLTEEQVDAQIRDGEKPLSGFRIALVHHPLDQLADFHEVRRLLADDGVDLLLHGHQHAPLSMVTDEPNARLSVVAAGCLMEGDLGRKWPNGFSLIEVDPETGGGTIEFLKWSSVSRGWARGTDLYRDAPHGVLSLPPHKTLRAHDARVDRPSDGSSIRRGVKGTADVPSQSLLRRAVSILREEIKLGRASDLPVSRAVVLLAQIWPSDGEVHSRSKDGQAALDTLYGKGLLQYRGPARIALTAKAQTHGGGED